MAETENQRLIEEILIQLDFQAQTGGTTKPNVDLGGEVSGGNFWPRNAWREYCDRVVKSLKEYGYSERDANKAVNDATLKVKLWD